MLSWLKSFFVSKSPSVSWDEITTGDFVRLFLKDPKKTGIISGDDSRLVHQRLDKEDLETLKIEGFVVRKEVFGSKPANIDTIELSVVKHRPNATLVTYILLREEIENIEVIL